MKKNQQRRQKMGGHLIDWRSMRKWFIGSQIRGKNMYVINWVNSQIGLETWKQLMTLKGGGWDKILNEVGLRNKGQTELNNSKGRQFL